MSVLGRLAREPLVQFLVGGLLLFALNAALTTRRGAAADERIVVSSAQAARLGEADGGSSPELEAFVREEVLVREARAIGLDRDDADGRRRLAQKMEFVLSEAAELADPTDAEAQAWYLAHREQYRAAPRVSFSHLLFSRAVRGDRASADAADALGQADRATGDGCYLAREQVERSALELTADFGSSFASRVLALPDGQWQGPVPSTFGAHLVKVTGRSPGELPTLDEVISRVRDDLLEQRRLAAQAAAFARLRARYTVELPSR